MPWELSSGNEGQGTEEQAIQFCHAGFQMLKELEICHGSIPSSGADAAVRASAETIVS